MIEDADPKREGALMQQVVGRGNELAVLGGGESRHQYHSKIYFRSFIFYSIFE